MIGWIGNLLLRLTVGCLRRLPPRLNGLTATAVSALVRRLPRKWNRIDVCRENLRFAFGDTLNDADADRLMKRMWKHLFQVVLETLQIERHVTTETIHDIIELRDYEKVLEAFGGGRPVILMSGHFGNWELANAAFGLYGFPLSVVARDLDNAFLHDVVRGIREHTGHSMISKKGGSRQMIDVLANAGRLALLADQDAGARAMFVDFFGRPASTFKSIALVALEYDAVICVGYAKRLDGTTKSGFPRFELGCEEIIDPREATTADPIREVTQRFTHALERVIRTAPEQYLWLHRRWKSDPEKGRPRRRRAA